MKIKTPTVRKNHCYSDRRFCSSLKSKLVLIMNLVTVFLTVACLQVSAAGFSQQITLSEKNVPLKKILQEIRKQSGHQLLYNSDLIEKAYLVTINVYKASIEEALTLSLQDQPFGFELSENVILIKPKADAVPAPKLYKSDVPPIDVRGKVTDVKGESLAGVSIRVKGTNMGTSTDTQGNFSLNLPDNGILVFTYLGFLNKEVTVNSNTTLNVQLLEDLQSLNEVVVTALGVVREKKALGYSVTELKGETLTQAREVNIGNSFAGKVAGVNVGSVAGGAGSSVNIQIRGMSSISGSNQPLYVINGVPMTNETSTGTGTGSYVDRGDNIGNINPDDIETISVLKGAAASALYGSRAKAGVILITTKSGKAGAPASVEFSSNYVIDKIIDQTDFQYEYGQGEMGYVGGAVIYNPPSSVSNAVATGLSSYGPKIDGAPSIQADGVLRPYIAAKNSRDNFYRQGGTSTNTLAFTKGFEGGSVRLSASNLANKGVTPNSSLGRQSFNASANFDVTKRLKLDFRTNYIIESADNRPKINDITGNVHNSILLYANTIDLRNFEDVVTTLAGNEFPLTGNVYVANPWYTMKHYRNNTNRNRSISSATLKYTFDNGLFLQGRAGRDYFTDRYTEITPTGSAYMITGGLNEELGSFNELNADFLTGKTFRINEDINVTPNLGASLRNVKTENVSSGGNGFAVPYVYYLTNVPARTVSYGLSEEEIQSVYGTLEMDYKNFLYITATARNDWFSTLAVLGGGNPVNKIYPSVSGSFVFSELLKDKSSWLSFGKLRAGYAIVGQATRPYQTSLTYVLKNIPLGNSILGDISGATVPNKELKASQASELEIGTDLRLYNGRLNLDFTWYNKLSTNEIVDAPTSITAGYTSASLNLGEMRNKGIEAMVTGIPIQTKSGFIWTTSVNGSMNDNKIISLAPGTSTLVWARARRGPAFIQYIVGKPAAQVVAFDYARNTDGSIRVNPSSGLAEPATTLSSYGSAYAKWVAGWSNDFVYKRLNFSFLIDGKFGHKIYSNTESESYTSGKNRETLVGRDKLFGNNQTAMQYYRNEVRISGNFVEDASFIKFRQVIMGYNFPPNLLNNRVKNLSLSFVARNLFVIMKRTDNIDPEASYTGGATGLDMGTVPAARTFGFNLSTKF